ncbi:MAG: hypothetical protein HDT47_05030 [Ruminococcaceae bacterium]|nr:hypothetical protein [Oscillospiraceae bacterium]
MKKICALFASLALALCLTGCNNNEISDPAPIQSSSTTNSSSETSSISEESFVSGDASESVSAESGQTEQNSTDPTPAVDEDKTLVVYFTWSSNTAGMAETIAALTGGDTFEIIPVSPYPTEYTPCTEVALEERDNNARPAIKDLPDSVSQYDNIIIGYPIWWHTAPMIIGTFLENYDLTGIDIYPFTQSASMDEEQFEQSMDFVRSCSGNGTVHDGLFAKHSDTAAITSYLEQNELTK